MKPKQNIKSRFAIMHFLDEIRWKKENAGGSVFNYDVELKSDEIILTHWLLYITERQMSFEQIWDKGGAVFSEIVKGYDHGTHPECVNITEEVGLNRKSTYFGRDGNKDKDGNETYSFTSRKCLESFSKKAQAHLNKYYTQKELKSNPIIEFKSRFYTTDYLSMYYTLNTLNKFDGSIINYLSQALEKILSQKGKVIIDKDTTLDFTNIELKLDYCVLAMAYALYRLTYNNEDEMDGESIWYFASGKKTDYVTYKTKQTNDNKQLINFAKRLPELSEKRTERIEEDIFKKDSFVNTLYSFFYEKRTGDQPKYNSMKRTWCALRDYLKSPVYKELFEKSIKEALVGYESDITALFNPKNNSSAACRCIELPGDVWNENSTFRICITDYHKGKLGKVLREQYNEVEDIEGYPEEFDTTFDFVPRMCEKRNCDICPFATCSEHESKKTELNHVKISSLCVENKEKYCPLILLYCGYYYKCVGDKKRCTLMNFFEDESTAK